MMIFVVYPVFYVKKFLNTALTIELGYFHVYSRKQKFLLRMYQEYLRLNFGKNIRMLSLIEKNHYFYKKKHVHFERFIFLNAFFRFKISLTTQNICMIDQSLM